MGNKTVYLFLFTCIKYLLNIICSEVIIKGKPGGKGPPPPCEASNMINGQTSAPLFFKILDLYLLQVCLPKSLVFILLLNVIPYGCMHFLKIASTVCCNILILQYMNVRNSRTVVLVCIELAKIISVNGVPQAKESVPELKNCVTQVAAHQTKSNSK